MSRDGGKTAIALSCVLEAVRAGETVVIFDEEAGAEQYVEKLLALGARPALNWPGFTTTSSRPRPGRGRPGRPARPAARGPTGGHGALRQLGHACRPRWPQRGRGPVLDQFYADVLIPAARVQAAAELLIGHLPKNGTTSRYTRGSGAKLAATDVAVVIECLRPFHRSQSGTLRIKVTRTGAATCTGVTTSAFEVNDGRMPAVQRGSRRRPVGR